MIKTNLAAMIAAVAAVGARFLGGPRFEFANIGEGTYQNGVMSRLTDAAIATRHMCVKFGSDVNHVALAGAGDLTLGVTSDAAEAAEDPVNVQILGVTNGTVLMTASAAIAAGALVVTSATAGKIRTLPGTTGTYLIIGMALEAAAADGDVINVAHCFPIQRVVP